MHKWSIRIALMAVAIVTALAGADRASAAGVVFIPGSLGSGLLSEPNTTYKLTTDLLCLGNCLVVANNKITIDLQGHSIFSLKGFGAGITDLGATFDVITVKNGTVRGFEFGVNLAASTRVSVLGVTVEGGIGNLTGIAVGPQGLVKASEVSSYGVGIQVGDRGQVQQCNVHHNGDNGIVATGDNCLITMNTANFNGLRVSGDDIGDGIQVNGNKCTVSYNTASNNDRAGIFAASGALVTQNVAMGNAARDFQISCPSTVTNNDSTNGFPASYDLQGPGCHTVNNN